MALKGVVGAGVTWWSCRMVLAVGCVLIVNDPSVFHPHVHSSAFLSSSVSCFVGICDASSCLVGLVVPCSRARERQHDPGIQADRVSQQTLSRTQKRAGTAPSLRPWIPPTER
jgi:hypothetical protein